MARLDENYAPYAPPSNVLALIRRLRDRGIPDTLTAALLDQLGIPQLSQNRTLAALQFLGLIEEDGTATPLFKGLQTASAQDYPKELTKAVRSAYEQVFQAVDPSTATEHEIEDAFRPFSPPSQRRRMVTLFNALCREAGILEGEPQLIRQTKRGKPSKKKDSTVRVKAPTEKESGPTAADRAPRGVAPQPRLSPMMTGIFQSLPPKGTPIPDEQKEQVAQIFRMVLNVDYPEKKEGD